MSTDRAYLRRVAVIVGTRLLWQRLMATPPNTLPAPGWRPSPLRRCEPPVVLAVARSGRAKCVRAAPSLSTGQPRIARKRAQWLARWKSVLPLPSASHLPAQTKRPCCISRVSAISYCTRGVARRRLAGLPTGQSRVDGRLHRQSESNGEGSLFCPVWWPRFGGISPPNWPLTSHSLGRLARLLSSGGIPPFKRCPTLRRRVAVRSRTTASPGS